MEGTEINYEWDLTQEAASEEVSETEVLTAAIEEAPAVDEFSLDVSHYDEKTQEDMLWQARTGLNLDTLCGAIETIIFMSDRPISIQKIKAQIDNELPLRVIHESLTKLQAGYEEKFHGIRLVEVAEGYQFRTKATYSKFVQNLFKVNSLVLTPTALEVLAIIAYKQPVSKTEVEKIRGVDSSHIIRALMDKRLVKITGRSEELGRPSMFGTTEEFLEVFNLADISALPPEYELEEMATKNTIGTIADIKSVVFRPEAKKFNADEFEELDKLSENISSIASDTNFTSLLKFEEKKKSEGEQTVRKSAFDILEEFVNKDASLKQMMQAISSETLMNVVDPKVIDIAMDMIFNAPDVDAEFEAEREREMAELDAEEIEASESETDSELELAAQEADEAVANLLKSVENETENTDLENEAMELEKALDAAFEQLTGEKIAQDEMEFSVDGEIKDLDLSIDLAIMKGKDMGVDLGFLADTITSIPESSEET